MAVKTGPKNPVRGFGLVGVPKTSVPRDRRRVENWICPLRSIGIFPLVEVMVSFVDSIPVGFMMNSRRRI